MDFIAAGMEGGLNRTGDFLDTITEYSTQFQEGGASAAEFFSFLDTGLAGGMLGTDKAADAFKEFRVRIMDGSATTSDALESLGFDADMLTASLADGTITVMDAWRMVTSELSRADDQALQMQAGVGLIGTQFEDLGATALLQIDPLTTTLEDMAGATDKLGEKYTSFPAMFEGVKRKVLVKLAPISDAMLRMGEVIIPIIMDAFDKLGPFIDTFATNLAKISGAIQGFIENVSGGMEPLEALKNLISNLMINVFGASIEQAMAFQDTFDQVKTKIQEILTPIIEAITNFVSFKDVLIVIGGVIAATVIPIIISLITAVAPIIAAVAAVIAIVALLRNAWENDWGGIQTKLTELWEGKIQPALAQVWEWLKINVPEALEALRAFWVEVAWPAIQNAIEIVWPIIQDIFNSIVAFVRDTLIPTIKDLYEKWTTEWWPTIQTVLENVWTIIEEIFTELGRWINDNIIPWIEFLAEKWTEEVWPAIQTALETAWGIIKPILEKIKEWAEIILPPVLEFLQEKFELVFGKIGEAVQPVLDLWTKFKDAVKNFWNWLKGKVFNFKINLPDLPDWATPGSPLPIHTAWLNFAKDMGAISANLPSPPLSQALAVGGNQTTTNFFLTANYRYQDQASLAQDIQTLEMLRG
jgi:phage-related minor tail protein